ncbi:MAG: YlmH/Sll1252 family protein [Lachnospiraceae bacterium]|nr:YlmH/Sll1252 family protein [Lachnospiraceae bacterium]
MRQEEMHFQKRLFDLAQKAYMENRYRFTHFLNEMEQDIVLQSEQEFPVAVSLFGGNSICERKVAMFGEETKFGYAPQWPVALLRFTAVSKKFAEDLTHRDVLGALMNLGMEREMIGDIFLQEKEGYIFCVDTMADYITEQLGKIRHTIVHIEQVPLSVAGQLELSKGEPRQLLVASLRLDAVVAAVYHVSRQESQKWIREKRVFIGGRLSENNSGQLLKQCMVSVRGKGRFYFDGVVAETKKQKLKISIIQY